MDWKECWDKRIVKDARKDENLIKSLIEMSSIKEKIVNSVEIDENSALVYIPTAYDSLRELIEALALKKGFKIYNHECYTAFLKEIINEPRLGEEFDKVRIVRNSINYYGKRISIEDARKVINSITLLRKKIKILLGEIKK
ncbi:MAG: hypothetical protein BWY36_00423 [Candidatus Diapherotrites archaeon ADurb.Bin253]|jgi:uncharacterized protein (UPF0332 family)|nr:MAG: hypothetical protein BWY36_00423 [Candidatus Diapherotrites archaeon ADurb.Bin253]HNZ52081.1 hypothetical protein [Candidatus Pacearchaeota archaeon]HPX74618.1 hypothetical protein [Candidatus Pacearchaeota archaeon]